MFRKHALCGAATAVMAFACAAAGQAAETPRSGDVATVEDLIVTARRSEERAQDVPQALTALSGQALEERQVVVVRDLGKLAPNVFLQEANADASAITLSIRGQKQNDILMTLDTSVGVYVDGVNMPRAWGLTNSLVDISRVEVLRGPQGTLYGRNTTGGAISIYSNLPTSELGGSVAVTLGNYGKKNVTGVLNLPIADGAGLRLVAQRGKSDGYGRTLGGAKTYSEDSEYYRAVFSAPLGERLSVTATGYLARFDTGGILYHLANFNAPPAAPSTALSEVIAEQYFAAGGAPAGLSAALADPARRPAAIAALNQYVNGVGGDFYTGGGTAPNYATYRGGGASLNIDFDLSDDLLVRSISGYGRAHRVTALDTDATPFALLESRSEAISKYRSQELQLLGSHTDLKWVAGLFASKETGRDGSVSSAVNRLSATNPSTTSATIRNGSQAAFGQLDWTFAPQWTLTAGYRYSADTRRMASSNRNGTNPCLVPAPGVTQTPPGASQCPRVFSNKFTGSSWLGSLTYKPADNILAYGKVARGYRTGGQNLRGTTAIAAFAPFEPETVTEYELGLKSDLMDRRLRMNLAVFYDDYKNIQRTTIVANPTGAPVSLVTNAGQGKIWGVESETVLRAGDFTFTNSVGYVRPKYDEFADLQIGDRSGEDFGIAKWTGNVGARYAVPTQLGLASINVDYQWQSKVILSPEQVSLSAITQRAYGLVNARAALNLDSAGIEVAVFARNLLDKDYYVSATGLQRSLGYNIKQVGKPRMWGVELKKSFGGER